MSVSYSENSTGLSVIADHIARGAPWFKLMAAVPCRGLPTSWWYPEYQGDDAPTTRHAQQERDHQIRIAVAICNSCQFRVACVEWAIEHQEHGIWGGTFEGTRRKIVKARAKSAVAVTVVAVRIQQNE